MKHTKVQYVRAVGAVSRADDVSRGPCTRRKHLGGKWGGGVMVVVVIFFMC